jgi:hypothetical protein
MVNLSQAPSGRSNPGLWSRARFAAVLLPGMALALALGCAGTNSSSSAPTITSFTPTSGSYASTTTVTVTGTGFSAGVTGAAIGGAAVTTAGSVTGDTTVTFLVPAAAVTGVVSVTTTAGTASSGTMFVVVPSVPGTGVSPASGPINTLVTVSGYGLGVPGIASITLVNNSTNAPTPVTIITQTANQITFNIPEIATPGASTIVLTPSVVDGGNNVDVSFTVQPPS